jgi:uncharacterized protein YprB with RNaseH-like and TPR domain
MNSTKLYKLLKGMTKQEILKYSQQMCKHRHSYLEHAECLEKVLNHKERVGFLDIETSNFSASFGVVVTWCLKEQGGEIYEGYLTDKDFKDKNGWYDKRILNDCVETIKDFDRIVVYWGKDRRFDIPFLRTRAVTMGIEFPLYQENLVNDAYDIVKNKFKFGRNSLAAACTQLGIESKETQMSPEMWVRATIGRDKKAISWILQHNREDVISTEKLWNRISNFANTPKTSI